MRWKILRTERAATFQHCGQATPLPGVGQRAERAAPTIEDRARGAGRPGRRQRPAAFDLHEPFPRQPSSRGRGGEPAARPFRDSGRPSRARSRPSRRSPRRPESRTSMPASAISMAASAMAAPVALRKTQGSSTSPPSGSQMRPSVPCCASATAWPHLGRRAAEHLGGRAGGHARRRRRSRPGSRPRRRRATRARRPRRR